MTVAEQTVAERTVAERTLAEHSMGEQAVAERTAADTGDRSRRGAPRGWVRVCRVTDLEVERGRAALLGGRTQIALFLLADGTVRAVSNYDPYGGAHVLSRGIVGTKSLGNTSQPSGNTVLSDSAHDASRDPDAREEIPTIASPLHKQAWDLRTGMVVETQGRDPRDIAVLPVAVRDGEVLVKWEETQ
ncbi:nitrite reductase (NAD(P)H) small subunit [Microbacterium sp.]|uniref:nitrite reductase (NAD(P)H) small subunit n=1 Tax=Microbacterium sp. TaxID=51671 RepID=UPI0028127608|nr:nitrite reductase (NAD(P)H) small subunit [Microbacterium sp.]